MSPNASQADGDPSSADTGKPGLFGTQRLEAFSDAVFAISCTLLVLQFKVPPAAGPDSLAGNLALLIGSHWPSFLGYALSFLVVGITWVNHHTMFQYIHLADRKLLIINLVFLLFVSFLPFPTALLADHLQVPIDRVTAMALYSATLLVMSIGFYFLWHYGMRLDLRANFECAWRPHPVSAGRGRTDPLRTSPRPRIHQRTRLPHFERRPHRALRSPDQVVMDRSS